MNQIEQLIAQQLDADPGDWALRLELARSISNRGEHLEAADIIGQAPELPHEAPQIVEAAKILTIARPRTAEIMLKGLLDADPDHTEARQLLDQFTTGAPPADSDLAPTPDPATETAQAPPASSPSPPTQPPTQKSRPNTPTQAPVLTPRSLTRPAKLTRRSQPEPAPVPTAPVVPDDAAHLHTQPPPDPVAIRNEALERTGLVTVKPFGAADIKQKQPTPATARRDKTSAVIVAVIVHVVIFVILGLIVLTVPKQQPPQIIAIHDNTVSDPVIDKKEVVKQARKPSAAAAAKMKVVSADAVTDVTMPVTDAVVETFEPIGVSDFGVGMSFGGADFGDGFDRGGGSAFGFTTGAKSDLVGSFYDVKQDRRGDPRENPSVIDEVRKFIDSGLSPDVLEEYFKAPSKLFATHLIVPVILAEEAPKVYGVDDKVDPGQWFIHYSGQISPHRTGSYRFVGKGDDILVVLVNGKVVLDGSIAGQNPTTWQTTEPEWQHPSPQWDGNLAYGDWVPLTAGKNYQIDIIFAEAPGGHLSGFLLTERRGGKYETATDGRPILPPFAVAPIPDKEWKRFKDAPSGGADPKLAYSPFDFARELELMKPAPER
ncbi:MAG: PA14 domain-containing protein [Verrucomicrobiota bacterium]